MYSVVVLLNHTAEMNKKYRPTYHHRLLAYIKIIYKRKILIMKRELFRQVSG